jgi:hypothetical protein
LPAYFDVAASLTSSTSAGTATSGAIRLLTGTAVAAAIKGVYVGTRSGTAGGGQMRLITAGTALSSMGTGITPNKRNPNTPYAAATTSAASGQTHANTTNLRASIGTAQTGGMGGWVAIEPDAAILLLAAGGANGNFEAVPFYNAASMAYDITVEFSEQ